MPQRREFEELTRFARASEDGPAEGAALRHWDVAFWAERQKEALYEVADEELKPFLPLARVLNGLFELVETLYGVRVEAVEREAQPGWHDDVGFYTLGCTDSGRARPGTLSTLEYPLVWRKGY